MARRDCIAGHLNSKLNQQFGHHFSYHFGMERWLLQRYCSTSPSPRRTAQLTAISGSSNDFISKGRVLYLIVQKTGWDGVYVMLSKSLFEIFVEVVVVRGCDSATTMEQPDDLRRGQRPRFWNNTQHHWAQVFRYRQWRLLSWLLGLPLLDEKTYSVLVYECTDKLLVSWSLFFEKFLLHLRLRDDLWDSRPLFGVVV